MSTLHQSLALNIASLGVFVWLWGRLAPILQGFPRWLRNGSMGLLMGLSGAASIYASTEVAPGMLFDLRAVPIIVAGYFGGPIAGLLASGLCAGYRYGLGGPEVWPAMLGIGFSGLLGMFGNQLKGLAPAAVDAAILSMGAAALPYATAALTFSFVAHPHWDLLLPLAIARGLGTLLCLWVLLNEERQSARHLILQTALAQVPDYFYVKDRDLRFVAVNKNVVANAGLKSARELLGRTDHELVAADRANRLAASEVGVMTHPEVALHEIECVPDQDGHDRWFETTKAALMGPDGIALGLVGVTRDITAAHAIEAELKEGRDLLNFLLGEMPVGVALFDRQGVLRYCNQRYRTAFPLTAHLPVPGTPLRTILQATLETGEQIGIEPGEADEWAGRVAASLSEANDQEVSLYDGSWLHISTLPTANGASLVVVSDITSMKGSERVLLKMTDQLAKIATIDAMTGALTRRAFDARLRAEAVKSGTSREAISLLMVDVDHFKLFNDAYGHLAGDACLGRVGRCLAAGIRPGDSLGRFGGEEFAVILPGAGSTEASEIASRLIASLADLALPHTGSLTGYVTVSMGIAVYEPEDVGRTPAELIKRADDALYRSKANGRNRATLWQDEDADVAWSQAG